jgi:hypothetical protein
MEAVTASPDVDEVWALIELVGAHSLSARAVRIAAGPRKRVRGVHLLRRMIVVAEDTNDLDSAEVRERIAAWARANPDRRFLPDGDVLLPARFTVRLPEDVKAKLDLLDDAGAFVRAAIAERLANVRWDRDSRRGR